MNYRLSVIHSFDPRGAKVGGLETFIRDMIAFLPDDFSFLMIGVDALGDLELGKVTRQTFRGKEFDFLPVLRYPDEQAREAARSIRQSINFQFMQALLRHIATVRSVLRTQPTSVDLQRVDRGPVGVAVDEAARAVLPHDLRDRRGVHVHDVLGLERSRLAAAPPVLRSQRRAGG